MYYDSNDYLAHHGIKGQKWGIRRYQNEDGSLTQLGRQRRGISDKSITDKIKDSIKSHKEKKAAKAKESEAEQHEALKQYVRKHPSKLYKHRTEFSDDEIRDLTNKIRTDTALKDIRDAEIQRGWDKIQRFSQNMGKIKGLAENAKGLYNLAAEVNNLMVDSGKSNGKKMLKIGEKPEKQKDTWFEDALNAGNLDLIQKNMSKLTTDNILNLNKYDTQMGIMQKNHPEWFEKETEYVGKHLAHFLDADVGDIIDSEDISAGDDFLAHHGILGMKWGIRRFQNKDGTLTDAGKQRYSVGKKEQDKVHEIVDKARFDEDISEKIFDLVHADKKYLKDAHAVLDENLKVQKDVTKETDALFKDLRSEEKLHVYEAASELAYSAMWQKKSVDDCSAMDLGNEGFMGVLEDGQQGPINAYSMYTFENHLEDKVAELGRKSNDSYSSAREQVKGIVSNALEEVGANGLTASPRNPNYSVASAITMHMMNDKKWDSWKDTNGFWYLNDAEGSVSFTDKDKENMAKAKNYVSKINRCKDANTWYYVYDAVENLGLDNKRLGDFTQSDWDKINAEIADLRND